MSIITLNSNVMRSIIYDTEELREHSYFEFVAKCGNIFEVTSEDVADFLVRHFFKVIFEYQLEKQKKKHFNDIYEHSISYEYMSEMRYNFLLHLDDVQEFSIREFDYEGCTIKDVAMDYIESDNIVIVNHFLWKIYNQINIKQFPQLLKELYLQLKIIGIEVKKW